MRDRLYSPTFEGPGDDCMLLGGMIHPPIARLLPPAGFASRRSTFHSQVEHGELSRLLFRSRTPPVPLHLLFGIMSPTVCGLF